MSRSVSILLLVLVTGAVHAAEGIVIVPEADVRSGPSPMFYATCKLQQNDRVEIIGEAENGYWPITPPRGSFSLVPRDAIVTQGNNVGVISKDEVNAIAGSTVVGQFNVSRSKLARGTQVTILDEVTIPTFQGPTPHYRILPIKEIRYIPVTAVQKQQEVVQAGASSGGQTYPESMPANLSPENEALLRRARQAYRTAETTGDWTEARRLYEDVARCPNHDARMEAWSRLEFMRRKQGLVASRSGGPFNTPPAGQVQRVPSAGQALRPSSAYTYAQDRGTARLMPVPTSPAAPAFQVNRIPPTQTGSTNQANYVQEASPAKAAATMTGTPGRLRRSYRTDKGRPLYVLVDSQGFLKCYVLPGPGVDLEPHVESLIEVQGSPMLYRGDLRSNLVTAQGIRSLGN